MSASGRPMANASFSLRATGTAPSLCLTRFSQPTTLNNRPFNSNLSPTTILCHSRASSHPCPRPPCPQWRFPPSLQLSLPWRRPNGHPRCRSRLLPVWTRIPLRVPRPMCRTSDPRHHLRTKVPNPSLRRKRDVQRSPAWGTLGHDA